MKKTITNKLVKLLFQAATACTMLCACIAYAGLPTANNGAGDISLTGAADGNPDATGGGTYLATSGGQFYSYDGGVNSGYLYSYVYAAGVDPLNTLGGLTFVYYITNRVSPPGPVALGELQVGSPSSGSFWDSTVELGYSPASSDYPATGSLDLDSEVTFNWTPPAQGIYQYYVVVGTSLEDYALTTAIVGDGSGGNSGNVSVLTPVEAPEPSTAALLLSLGIGLIFALRKARTV